MGSLLIAIILGIIEGLAEFLPISSTGHLILAGYLLDFTGEKAATFDIFIQLGGILAVVILYFKRFLKLLDVRTIKADEFNILKIFLGILPAVVGGLFLHDFIKEVLFSPYVVVFGLVVGSFFMMYAESRAKNNTFTTLDNISYKQSFFIGLFQCLALVPGFSRSGATISGGLLLGGNKKAAAEFSFLVAVPIMLGAVGLDLIKTWDTLQPDDFTFLLTGFFTAFVVALIAIVTFLKLLEKVTFKAFAYYRLILAFIMFVYLFFIE